jgi:hypothetical protein
MKRLLLLVLAVALLGLVPGTASAAPSNDDFANATRITSPSDLPTETNVGATIEPGEPTAGFLTSSVWYTFTPRRTRDYTVSLCNSSSSLDVAVTVYTGRALTHLRQASQGIETCGTFPGPGMTSWIARRGVTYHIQVAGFVSGTNPFEGTFDLQLTPGPGGLYISDAARREGNRGKRPMFFTVSLGTPARHPVAVRWFTTDCFIIIGIPCLLPGGATAGIDYVGNNGVIFFKKGQRTKRIAVEIIGDREVETNETFNVFLAHPHGAPITQGFATGTIVNDDRGL